MTIGFKQKGAGNTNSANTGTGSGTTAGNIGNTILKGFEIFEFAKMLLGERHFDAAQGRTHLGEAIMTYGGANITNFLKELNQLETNDQHRLMKHHIRQEDAKAMGENTAKLSKAELKIFITSHCTTSAGRDIDEAKAFIKTEYPKIKLAQEDKLLTVKKQRVPSGFRGLFKIF